MYFYKVERAKTMYRTIRLLDTSTHATHATLTPCPPKEAITCYSCLGPRIKSTSIIWLSQVVQPQSGSVWKGGQAADDVMRVGYCSGSVRQRWCKRPLVCVEGEVRADPPLFMAPKGKSLCMYVPPSLCFRKKGLPYLFEGHGYPVDVHVGSISVRCGYPGGLKRLCVRTKGAYIQFTIPRVGWSRPGRMASSSSGVRNWRTSRHLT